VNSIGRMLACLFLARPVILVSWLLRRPAFPILNGGSQAGCVLARLGGGSQAGCGEPGFQQGEGAPGGIGPAEPQFARPPPVAASVAAEDVRT
jgi:hypothetical protein